MISFKKQYVTGTVGALLLSISLCAAVALTAVALLVPDTAQAVSAGSETAQEQAAASILQNIRRGTWITEGRSPHIIYIFFDPNCPYCHKLYEDLRPWVNHNQVQIRWLPVGVLMATSQRKAAAILQARNRLAALRQNEQGFSQAAGFGQIKEEPMPKPAIIKDLRANEALLQRAGQEAVPAMVFRVQGGTPIVIQGAPPRRILQRIIEQLQ